MTVLELAELLEASKEKYNVSAARVTGAHPFPPAAGTP